MHKKTNQRILLTYLWKNATHTYLILILMPYGRNVLTFFTEHNL